MREPLLIPLAGWILGLMIARWTAWGPAESLTGATLLLLLAWAARRMGALWTARLAIALACAVLAAWDGTVRRPEPPADLQLALGVPLRLEGCVLEGWNRPVSPATAEVELRPGASVRISAPGRPGTAPPPLPVGQRVEFSVTLREARGYRNPGSFDYDAWLANHHIFWQARLLDASLVDLRQSCGSPLHNAMDGLRTRALDRLNQLYPRDEFDRGMLKGLLLGDSTEIRKVWVEDFRRTGTFHALVISGSHIVLVAGIFLLWLRRFRFGEGAVVTAACLVAWMYALIAGAAAPVMRSAAGFTLAVSARLFYRKPRVLNLLAAAALIFLILDPIQIEDASFLLSFLAVAAIGALYDPLREHVLAPFARAGHLLLRPSFPLASDPTAARWRVRLQLWVETLTLLWPRWSKQWPHAANSAVRAISFIGEAFLLSACVQLALALPMILYFHRVSISGLSANIVATPIMTATVPVGFAALFTGWSWLAALTSWLLKVTVWIVGWHARWEPDWRMPDPPLWLALALVGACIVTAICLRLRPQRILIPAIATLALLALAIRHPFAPLTTPGTLELTAIDVGQGDSLLLLTPSGQSLLVDAGGLFVPGRTEVSFDTGEDVVSPYLWSRGIRRLDAIAVTHLHQDHAGGLAAIIANFRPRELWTGATPAGREWTTLRTQAERYGVRVRPLHQGDSIRWGDTHLRALAPAPDYAPRRRPDNEDSLVLRVSYRSRTALLTGDIDRRIERELLDAGLIDHIDVLKVAHHGSRTGYFPDFLDAVRPGFAMVCVGRANLFHLPNAEVIDGLKQRGAMVLRTDEHGLVRIQTDGWRIRQETFAGRPVGCAACGDWDLN